MSPGRIVVIGLGPAGPELVTAAALDALDRIPHRYVRTMRHPAASVVKDAVSFDDVYERASTMDGVYEAIVDSLVEAARAHGEVVYAVPGSPSVAERTVALLRSRAGADVVEVEVVPAMSFLDLAWSHVGDPVASGIRLVDGHRFVEEAGGERGPLLVAQCDSVDVLSTVKLAYDREAPSHAVVLQRLGMPDERVFEVEWADLDRLVVPDHLTSIVIPNGAPAVGAELVRFAEVVRQLREDCPWDRKQTHESLVRYVIEETYEVVEAIASGDPGVLEEELGDLLLQVFLHAAIAAQDGSFTIADVAAGITEKMVRRHPHVFGDVEVADADEVATNWERIKADEKPAVAHPFDSVPAALPALSYATELSRKAAKVGFEWPDIDGVWDKLDEEVRELREDPGSLDELGDVLMVVVNLARHLGHDAEGALRVASAKFRRRFDGVVALAEERGIDLSTCGLDALEALWQEVKRSVRVFEPERIENTHRTESGLPSSS